MKVKFKKLSDGATIPEYANEHAAGIDLYAAESTMLFGDRQTMIATDIAWEPEKIPGKKVYMKIEGRSGNASKEGVDVLGGVIDEDYRGNIKVTLSSVMPRISRPFKIRKGDRIAQGIIYVIPQVEVEEVTELEDTERGDNGFGSTGK